MEKINEREVAVYALMDIMEEGGYNNIVLRQTLNRYGALEGRQKAFITEVVNGTLRNIIMIDYVIDQFSKISVDKMKPLIANLLRISIYQIRFMEKVPESAVVNEAVQLASKKGYKNLKGFVNGLLRNMIRNRADWKLPGWEEDPVAHLSICYSYPRWIIDYWRSFMDLPEIKALCEENNKPPKVTLCVNTLKTSAEALQKALLEEGVKAEKGNYSPNALIVRRGGNVTAASCFEQGFFHIMDEGAMAAVEAAALKPGMTVLDMCAAPGGKSFYSAYIMENSGKIIAADIHAHKLNLLMKTAQRLGVENIRSCQKDMRGVWNEFANAADVVLLDAPCSGLGLMRKKPDIKYTKTMADIDALAMLQRRMLQAAAEYVKVGGVLLYSTCTISAKENEENIRWFLQNYQFDMDEISGAAALEQEEKGILKLLPHRHGTDGFFIARMVKRG